MNKNDLVKAIAEDTSQSQAAVGEVLAAFEACVTKAVAAGEKVQLPG
ncbi:MAG: HU family DNA-binding protein, partial [bacterium]